MKKTKLADIKTDRGTQTRIALDPVIVDEYTEAYRRGDKMPPLDVFVSGKERILADGFHRHAGAIAAELKEVDCNLHEGSASAALKFALAANHSHGLRRSAADKVNAVQIALKTFPELSNGAIADLCHVSRGMVLNHRPEEPTPPTPPTPEPLPPTEPTGQGDQPTPPAPPPPPPAKKKRVGKDGKSRSVPAKPARKDATGFLIPVTLVESWDYALEAKAQVTALRSLKGMAQRAEDGNRKEFAEVNFQSLKAAITQAAADWELAVPYAVCPSCNGVQCESCTACKKRGFVSEFFWNTCVATEVKQARK